MKKGNYIKIMGLLVILFFLFGCQRKQYELQFVRRDDSYVVTGINTFNQEEVVVTIPKKHKGLYVTEIHGLQSEAIIEVKFEKGSHISKIENSALSGNKNLKQITIPSSVKTIGSQSFYNNSHLTSIHFDENSQLESIGEGAFSYNINLKQVHIPKTVTYIGKKAFSYNSQLEEVTFEEGIQLIRIESELFSHNVNLKNIVIPKSVEEIANLAFDETTSLLSVSIEEGSNLKWIGHGAFLNSAIESITIPQSVAQIDDYAFYSTSHLRTVSFEEGTQLSTLGEYVFVNDKITDLTINNHAFTSIDGILYNNDITKLIQFPGGKVVNTVTIPQSVQEISVGAFSHADIRSLKIPNTVKQIGEYAFKNSKVNHIQFEEGSELTSLSYGLFENAEKLSSIELPDQLQTINHSAFKNAKLLKEIVIPKTVKTIHHFAFSEAKNLEHVIFEEGSELALLGSFAFSGTSNLNHIEIPKGVTNLDHGVFKDSGIKIITFEENSQLTSIQDAAFENAQNLETFKIPNSVTYTSPFVFLGTTNLTNIEVEENNPSFTSIEGILYSKDQRTLVKYPAGKSETTFVVPDNVLELDWLSFADAELTSITIHEQVNQIGRYAFYQANDLKEIDVDSQNERYTSMDGVLYDKGVHTLIKYPNGKVNETFNIPSTITKIEESAFNNNQLLKEVTIAHSVVTIDHHAFSSSVNLIKVIFEENSQIEKIELDAFSHTKNLTSILFNDQEPLTVNIDAFHDTKSDFKLLVPKDSLTKYKETPIFHHL